MVVFCVSKGGPTKWGGDSPRRSLRVTAQGNPRVPGKKVPAFYYDSPGTLERGTQRNFAGKKEETDDSSSSFALSIGRLERGWKSACQRCGT